MPSFKQTFAFTSLLASLSLAVLGGCIADPTSEDDAEETGSTQEAREALTRSIVIAPTDPIATPINLDPDLVGRIFASEPIPTTDNKPVYVPRGACTGCGGAVGNCDAGGCSCEYPDGTDSTTKSQINTCLRPYAPNVRE